MRRRYIGILAALAISCSSPTAPSSAVAGTWAENLSVVGASLVLALDGSGNGNGTYAIEAGRSGTLQVSGHLAETSVSLTLLYDYGLVRTFTGTLTDATHLTGTFADASGVIVFTRR